MIQARWNIEKAKSLKENEVRDKVEFEECVVALEENRVLADLPHPTRPNQRIFVLEINGYAHVVPYVEEENGVFLKTVFPRRRHHAQYLGNKKP
jgi:hypothetical protein